MTNEEAVKILRRIQEPEAWEPQINGAAFEALDMAIEALGRQQAAGSKDLISRSSLLAKYDEQHEGPPGRARKLIEDEPPVLGTNLAEVGTDCITRQAAIKKILGQPPELHYPSWYAEQIKELPPAEPKRGKWILDRSGAYCCSECMEPCAGYVMMRPRDRFCKMCGSRNEVTK